MAKVKEYNPIFVNTWFIMLQNYIDKRDADLEVFEKHAKDKVYDQEKF